MKNYIKHYLIISFLLGYISFGIIIISDTGFVDIFSNPFYLLLLTIGFLSPFIASLIVYAIHNNELGGIKGFKSNFKIIKSNKALILVFVLLITHYAFGIIFKNIGAYGNLIDFIKYLPFMVIFLGSQEIGWRKIIQPYFERRRVL